MKIELNFDEKIQLIKDCGNVDPHRKNLIKNVFIDAYIFSIKLYTPNGKEVHFEIYSNGGYVLYSSFTISLNNYHSIVKNRS